MKKLSLSLAICFVVLTCSAQKNATAENVQTLLELTGSGKLGIQLMQNMIAGFNQTYPDVPKSFWEDFMKEVNADSLNSMLVPIYSKNFSNTEITELITFYNTPLGKKLIATMPGIMQESMQAGQVWGRQLAEKVFDKLKLKGYVKEQ